MTKRIVLIVIACLSLIGAVSVYVSYRNASSELASINRKIADVENEIAAKKALASARRVEVLETLGGISERRLNDDDTRFSEMANVAFTWSGYEEYCAMRESLMSDYGMKSDCQMLTDFWPYVPEIDLGNGRSYNYIDAEYGMSVEFSDIKTYCIGVSGDVYHYFGIIYWRACGRGGSSYLTVSAFMADMNSDGDLDDFRIIDVEN